MSQGLRGELLLPAANGDLAPLSTDAGVPGPQSPGLGSGHRGERQGHASGPAHLLTPGHV